MALGGKKHLIIFGCGYVGGEVARQALQRGLRVTALTRNPEKATALRSLGATVVLADLAENSWHNEIVDPADYVLNAVSSGGRGIDGYRHSYFAGMQSILAWAEKHGPVGTLVYTSSTSVYPQGGGGRVDEDASTNGASERAQVLVDTEGLLLASAKRDRKTSEGLSAVTPIGRYFILRLAGIYGPGRHHLVDQVRTGSVAGHGDHRLNLAHRDDIASAIWAVLDSPDTVANEIFNVADDEPSSKAEVVAWLARELGLPTPQFTGEPAAGRRTVTPDRVIENAKLKALLGWRPAYPNFREGYKNMLAPSAE